MGFDFVSIDTKKRKKETSKGVTYLRVGLLLLSKILGILVCVVGIYGLYEQNNILIYAFLGGFFINSIILAISVSMYRLIKLNIIFLILCIIFIPQIGFYSQIQNYILPKMTSVGIDKVVLDWAFGIFYMIIAFVFVNICSKISNITRNGAFNYSSLIAVLVAIDFGFLGGFIDNFIFEFVKIKNLLLMISIAILAIGFLIFNPKTYEK